MKIQLLSHHWLIGFVVFENCLLVSTQESMKEDYIKKVKDTIKLFSDYLGEKTWITGDKVCVSLGDGSHRIVFP